MPIDPETDKKLQELGAAVVSLREDLEEAKKSPRDDPGEITKLREELKAAIERYDKAFEALKPKPPDAPKPAVDDEGFGFFRWPGSEEPTPEASKK